MRSYTKKVPVISDYDALVARIPELASYRMPEQGSTEELIALQELCSALRDETDVSISSLIKANHLMSDIDFPSPAPAWFTSKIDLADVLDAISHEDRSKHPGFPACLFAFDKGVAIDCHFVDLIIAVAVRMICLEHIGPYCETPEDFYNTFCSDFSCLSIKSEAVKVGKTGRVISSTSLVSSIVEELFYFEFNNVFKDHVYETYSAIGIGFTPRDSELLHASVTIPAFESDVPKFDSTVSELEGLLNVQLVLDSYGPVPSKVQSRMISMEKAYFNKIFILSDGSLYAQTVPGMQSTGRKQTANFNTMTRARRSFAVDFKLASEGNQLISNPVCAGDDCEETPHPIKESTYLDLGFPLRDTRVASEMSFCSHEWPVGLAPIGIRIYKSLYRLLTHKVIEYEQFLAFVREYGTHPEFPAIFHIISEYRPEMKYFQVKMFIQKQQMLDQVSDFSRFQVDTPQSGPTQRTVNDSFSPDGYDFPPEADFDDNLPFSTASPPVYDLATRKKKKKLVIVGQGDYSLNPRENYDEMDSRLKKLEDKTSDIKQIVERTGSKLGRVAGNLIGQGNIGAKIGGKAAKLASKFFGMGDYEILSNSLIKGGLPTELPKFANNRRGVRIADKEYIGDVRADGTVVSGATIFSNKSYVINPADTTSFPWLSKIAAQYEEYEPHGIVYEFRSTSSEFNGVGQALGTIIMGTDYDPTDPPYADKREMEQSDYASSTKPSNSMYHGIECDPKERSARTLFTRSTNVPTGESKKFYDLGNFQIATQGMTGNAVLGELWVTYDITFYKKQLNSTTPYVYMIGDAITPVTTSNVFGKPVQIFNYAIGVSVAGTSVTCTGIEPNTIYQFVYTVFATTNIVPTNAAPTITGDVVTVYDSYGLNTATGVVRYYAYAIFKTSAAAVTFTITMPPFTGFTGALMPETTITKLGNWF